MKVGDKVKVKDFDLMCKLYGVDYRNMPRVPHGFNREMIVYCGTYLTIRDIFIDEEGETDISVEENYWHWHPKMFELKDTIAYWIKMESI